MENQMNEQEEVELVEDREKEHHSHHGEHHHHHSSHHRGKHRRHRSSNTPKKKANPKVMWGIAVALLAVLMLLVFVFEVVVLTKFPDVDWQEPTFNPAKPTINTGIQFPSISIREWDTPIYDAHIPVFELSEEKPAMTDAEKTPDAIYAMYDALMAKHPEYITKTDLGLCSDGINHVYRYDFKEPDSRHTEGLGWSETKTKAILVSGIHYEWGGIFGLYYALEEIANNPELYGFRRNSHLIVVPCVNPFATIGENYRKSEGVKNANGVEIHRNFEVDWKTTDESEKHYGGPSPLSAVEAQYIDNIMKENTDSALFLTCHSYADESFNFIWPSVATPYMCNMGYRLIDKMSNNWLEKYQKLLVGLDDYRAGDIEDWDNRLGYAHISGTNGTETKQATKYGIQGANVEICERFWTHGTKENPEPWASSFTMSRGAEVYVNFLLTAFGVYDAKDKLIYGAG